MHDKKTAITMSAIEVFQRKGIEHAKVSDIVKGAGIAQGTFYLYFQSKLSVMPSIAEVMVEKMIKGLKSGININDCFDQQLKDFIEMIFDLTKQYRDIFALIYAGLASSEYLVNWEDIYDKYYNEFAKIIDEAQNNNSINPLINSKRYAVLLIGLIESAAEQSYLYDKQSEQYIKIKKQEVFNFAMKGLSK